MAKTLIVAGLTAVLCVAAGMYAGAVEQKKQAFPFLQGATSDKERLVQEINALVQQRLALIKADQEIRAQKTKLYDQMRVIMTQKIKPLQEQMDKNALQLATFTKRLVQDETQLKQLARGNAQKK